MSKFNQVKDTHIETLELYVPIVARVHGEEHPEFHKVRGVFDQMNVKMKEAGPDRPELDGEFSQLREITDNYRVPEDTCESYEAVYNMLSDLDDAYNKSQ